MRREVVLGGWGRQVAFDVETCGLSAGRGGRVIEIGAVSIESGRPAEEYSTLIGVPVSIQRMAQRVHGIDAAMLRGKPEPRAVWPAFLRFVAGAPLIAHNAQFDEGFLRHELGRLGLGLSSPVHCSLKTSRRLFPGLPDHRLETVARHLLGEVPADCRLHRALGDARLLARVWIAMSRRGKVPA